VLDELRKATAEANATADRKWKRIAGMLGALATALGSAFGVTQYNATPAPPARQVVAAPARPAVQTTRLDLGTDAPGEVKQRGR
jgi:hypothetical protein